MKGKIVKSLIALCLVATMVMSSFAAVVSADDSSSFVTKAEFEAIKSNYDNQIKGYLSSVDEKIDNTIANYLNNFAGGAGNGTIKMSERTGVYAHTFQIKEVKVNHNGNQTVKCAKAKAGVFTIFTTYKEDLTLENFASSDSEGTSLIADWDWVKKYGLAAENMNTIKYDDFWNDTRVGIATVSEIVKFAEYTAPENTETIKYNQFKMVFAKNEANEGFRAWFQLGLDDAWGGYLNWDDIVDYTYSKTLISANPIVQGSRFNLSGEMVADKAPAMGFGSAVFKHELEMQTYGGTPYTKKPVWTIYTTYPYPLTHEDFPVVNDHIFMKDTFAAEYGFWMEGDSHEKKLLYEDFWVSLAAKADVNYVRADYPGTCPGKKGGFRALIGTWPNSVGSPLYYIEFAGVDGGYYDSYKANLNQWTWIDHVSIATTNPVAWGARKLITGEMLHDSHVSVSGIGETGLQVKSNSTTEYTDWVLQNRSGLKVVDTGAKSVFCQLFVIMKVASEHEAAPSGQVTVGSFYWAGKKISFDELTSANCWSRAGNLQVLSENGTLYCIYNTKITTDYNICLTFNGTISRASLVAAGILK